MDAAGAQPKPGPRKSGIVVPHQTTRMQRLGAWAVFIALRGITLTLRTRWDDRSGYFNTPPARPAIYVVWHNRLALCLEIHVRFVVPHRAAPGRARPGLAAMVSASKDGGFLTRILERYGVQPVRGSSSRRGPQALLELAGWAERGYDLAITPDGPRGPRYVVQDGVMSLAQITGLPIIPVSYSLSGRIQLKSWDGFLVPLPFARWTVTLAPPIRVPRNATDVERANLRAQLETTLRKLAPD